MILNIRQVPRFNFNLVHGLKVNAYFSGDGLEGGRCGIVLYSSKCGAFFPMQSQMS